MMRHQPTQPLLRMLLHPVAPPPAALAPSTRVSMSRELASLPSDLHASSLIRKRYQGDRADLDDLCAYMKHLQREGYDVDSKAWASALGAAAARGDRGRCRELYEAMLKEGVAPITLHFTYLVSAHAKSWGWVDRFLGEAKRRGVEWDDRLALYVCKALRYRRDLSSGEKLALYCKIQEKAASASDHTPAALLPAFLMLQPDFKTAREVLQRHDGDGAFSRYVYVALLVVCKQAADPVGSEMALEMMEAAGFDAGPDDHALVISSKRGDDAEVLRAWGRMEKRFRHLKPFAPDVYRQYINALEDDVGEAELKFAEAVDAGHMSHGGVWAALLSFYYKKGLRDKFLLLSRRMSLVRVRHTPRTSAMHKELLEGGSPAYPSSSSSSSAQLLRAWKSSLSQALPELEDSYWRYGGPCKAVEPVIQVL